MNPLTKFETIGMFVAVAVMALALAAIRFNADTFAVVSPEPEEQVASLVTVSDDMNTIAQEITDNVSLTGTLTKLVIDDVRIGTGRQVATGDTVSVHYVGTLRDGTKFDDSYLRGEPFSFTVGDGMVIRGWEEGLVGMQVGGERILVIPPDMAYGNRNVGPIPANSPLIFKIELLSIE